MIINEVEILCNLLLDKNEIITLKTVGNVCNKNLHDSKILFNELLEYLNKNHSNDKIYGSICSFEITNKESNTYSLCYNSLRINQIPVLKYKNIISLQKFEVDNPNILANVNQDLDSNFYQKFLGDGKDIIEEPIPAKPKFIEEVIENKVSQEKNSQKENNEPKFKETPVVIAKETKKKSAAKKTKKIIKECSDEEPLPKYIKTSDTPPISQENSSSTVKKRVLKEYTFKDQDGYLVTEKRYEQVEESIETNKLSQKSKSSQSQKSSQKNPQGNSLMSYFKKSK